ncbi:hypothetical protein [Roseateles amylovorans]|uniref:Bacteriocin n=1 Tax=Roseateles amylovorans TaxID=2978473 RepID=A0ABY6B100_9BURK|nr:hypothetical protein [Roseateles amylovorans]UXH78730.1 hypothetical protein N4261_01960 [Roseateles amylovorans]
MTPNSSIQLEVATQEQEAPRDEIRELSLQEVLAVAGGPQVTNDANI